MADEEHAERPPESRERSENANGPPGPLTLNTTLKRTFAAIVALVGVAAGIAVFTAPFAKTGPALISITLAALATIMLVGFGFAAFYTYRKKKITASVNTIVFSWWSPILNHVSLRGSRWIAANATPPAGADGVGPLPHAHGWRVATTSRTHWPHAAAKCRGSRTPRTSPFCAARSR